MEKSQEVLNLLRERVNVIDANYPHIFGKNSRGRLRFASMMFKVKAVVKSDLADKVEMKRLARLVGQAKTAYKIAQSLTMKYRWSIRRRITQVGSAVDRVQLDQRSSEIVTLDDLELTAPLRKVLMYVIFLASQAAEDILSEVSEVETEVDVA